MRASWAPSGESPSGSGRLSSRRSQRGISTSPPHASCCRFDIQGPFGLPEPTSQQPRGASPSVALASMRWCRLSMQSGRMGRPAACALTGILRRVLRSRVAEAGEGMPRRLTFVGVSQVVLLPFGLVAAAMAVVTDGVEARNCSIVAVLMLGAFARGVRRDRINRAARPPC